MLGKRIPFTAVSVSVTTVYETRFFIANSVKCLGVAGLECDKCVRYDCL